MKADSIYVNGRVYTVNPDRQWAEAIAVCDNYILKVGKDEEIEALADVNTTRIDLKGKMVVPGFIDAHCHPISAAFFNTGLILDFEDLMDPMMTKIRAYVQKHPEDEFYFGRGFRENNILEMESPKRVLDEICPDKPFYLVGAGCHSAWCNSKALEIAGIDASTEDPDPGIQYYEREEDGTPNGSLIEADPMMAVLNALDPFTEEDVIREMKNISSKYNAAGVTAVQDGGAWGDMAYKGRKILKQILDEKEYDLRVETCEFVTAKSDYPGVVDRIREGNALYNDDYLRVGFLKVLDDGIYESLTCSMLEPYLDGSNCETLITTEQLEDVFLETAKAGFDMAVHNIGDKTARDVLLGAKAVREAGYDDARIVSIHSIKIHDDDYQMFKDYNVIANSSPQWCLASPYKASVIGPERASKTFMLKTLKGLAPAVSFGSDHPADEFGYEPLKGIEMGITRQLFDHPDMPVLVPLTERMTVREMIEGYTIDAAYQMRMEDKIGSIEDGKYADFAVLDQNLFEIDPHDIHKVDVLMTVFDGRIVYKA